MPSKQQPGYLSAMDGIERCWNIGGKDAVIALCGAMRGCIIPKSARPMMAKRLEELSVVQVSPSQLSAVTSLIEHLKGGQVGEDRRDKNARAHKAERRNDHHRS